MSSLKDKFVIFLYQNLKMFRVIFFRFKIKIKNFLQSSQFNVFHLVIKTATEWLGLSLPSHWGWGLSHYWDQYLSCTNSIILRIQTFSKSLPVIEICCKVLHFLCKTKSIKSNNLERYFHLVPQICVFMNVA